MSEKSSIHYIMSHEKIRNLVYEEWEKMCLLINQGSDVIKEYFCKLWNETKQELEYEDDIDIIDLDRQIKPSDFEISYSVLDNGMQSFNFIMPIPVTDNGQTVCLTLVITNGMPRLFTLELSVNKEQEKFYSIGEWQIDFKNNDYIYRHYESINQPIIGEFVGKINKILNSRN